MSIKVMWRLIPTCAEFEILNDEIRLIYKNYLRFASRARHGRMNSDGVVVWPSLEVF